MKVKICGLTTLADAQAALAAGADLLGFNFYPPSPRALTPETCRALLAELRAGPAVRPFVAVGVFVNHPAAEIQHILDFCGLELAQLSGDETPDELAALGGRAFKALRPRDSEDLARQIAAFAPQPTSPPAPPLKGRGDNLSPGPSPHSWRGGIAAGEAPAYLIDAYRPGEYGGTGQTADWSLAAQLARQQPILLAGGLTPLNVAAAVAQVQPWGVDVASGVEAAPGQKDPQKIQAFVRAAGGRQ